MKKFFKKLLQNCDLFKGKTNGFTLAEVLITLGIIGIVAAVTIPTLMKNYQQRTWDTSASVFEKKLSEALRIMNTQNTLAKYETTTDFVNALSKTMKISKVCNADHMDECFAGKLILSILDFDNGGKKSNVVKSIKLANDIGLTWNTEVVGVVFTNGVSAMLAYNPECIEEPYNNSFDGSKCVTGFYDVNGTKKPNRLDITADIRAYGKTAVTSNAAMKINGKYWTAPFISTPVKWGKNGAMSCDEFKSKYGTTGCSNGWNYGSYTAGDYWGGAVISCGGKSNMPKESDIKALANTLYKKGCTTSDCIDREKASIFYNTYGNNGEFYIFGNEEYSGDKSVKSGKFSKDKLSYGTTQGNGVGFMRSLPYIAMCETDL